MFLTAEDNKFREAGMATAIASQAFNTDFVVFKKLDLIINLTLDLQIWALIGLVTLLLA